MKKSLLLGFAALFPSFIHAQATTTVSLLLLDEDAGTLVASVIHADATSTVYLVNCEANTDENDCDTDNEWVTQGRNFFAMNVTAATLTATWRCDVQGTTSASCSESFGGEAATNPGTTRTVLSGSDITYYPVRVTGGVEKLSGGGGDGSSTTTISSSESGMSSTSLSATSNPSSTSPSKTAATTAANQASTSTATGSESGNGGGSSSSTAAATRQTWVPELMAMAAIGGAVVLI
ncbi:hypothetical protein NA57DRAFT_56151 [Rhizodiscina lignyota]|uniref:Uncharacterized protein n=1 Tax=Rhizodiscina lignyota TaxID=1504668 RepID=A0A9P4IFQ0_9PEZI|nr:hypothetical protein NA57DRAFT_56151 [Rhizodiscina lignyota]